MRSGVCCMHTATTATGQGLRIAFVMGTFPIIRASAGQTMHTRPTFRPPLLSQSLPCASTTRAVYGRPHASVRHFRRAEGVIGDRRGRLRSARWVTGAARRHRLWGERTGKEEGLRKPALRAPQFLCLAASSAPSRPDPRPAACPAVDSSGAARAEALRQWHTGDCNRAVAHHSCMPSHPRAWTHAPSK